VSQDHRAKPSADPAELVVLPRLRPDWLPPEGTRATRPAGQYWDAIQIDGASAWAILAHLTQLAPGGVGPVLCDPGGPTTRLTFLVPPNTTAAWNEPHTAALGPACWLTIPGDEEHDHPDGLHWLTPPGGPPEHVNPGLLRQAIACREATPKDDAR
jgi:hypothetical protein